MTITTLFFAQICFIATVAILFYASVVDIKRREISNLTVVGVIVVWLAYVACNVITRNAQLTDYIGRVIQALLVFAFLLVSTCVLEKTRRKELVGGGDLKLIGALCLHLSLVDFLIMLIIACVTSIIVSIAVGLTAKKGDRDFIKSFAMPWAPNLSIGYVLVNFGLFL